MSSRSLNKVILIGNLTRDPELRYTPAGTAVCTLGVATNRFWVTQTGETKEETEFHRIVAWNKLGELCSQLLSKGRKVYVEGRLSSRSWTGQDGLQRNTTEIVIEEMIILDSRKFVKSDDNYQNATGALQVKQDIKASGDTQKNKQTEPATATTITEETKTEKKSTKKTGEGEISENDSKPVKKSKEEKEEKKPEDEDITPDDIPF